MFHGYPKTRNYLSFSIEAQTGIKNLIFPFNGFRDAPSNNVFRGLLREVTQELRSRTGFILMEIFWNWLLVFQHPLLIKGRVKDFWKNN